MTIETLKSPNPRNRNSISVIKSKFLSVSSMNTLLAILKVTDARRDVILAGGLYHRFPWRHLPPPRLPRGATLKVGSKFTVFALLYLRAIWGQFVALLYLKAIFQLQAPGGLIFGGAYTWKGLFSEFYGILVGCPCRYDRCDRWTLFFPQSSQRSQRP